MSEQKRCEQCGYELQADDMIEGGFCPCEYCCLRRWNTDAQNLTRELADASQALIDRLKEIDEHPSYKGILGIAFAHGVHYTGPSWHEPLTVLEEVLAKLPKEPA